MGSGRSWQNQPAELGCARYFSAAIAETRRVEIDLEWAAPSTIRLAVPELEFEWAATLRASGVTTLLSAVGAVLPDRLWKAKPALSLMWPVAGAALRAGRVGLAGVAPNGQRFIANPLKICSSRTLSLLLRGIDFGAVRELDKQTALGDFWIPQRGIFAMGRACFTAA
jgi:hypothetical protein